ncbi:MAG: glycoside hydrolase family 127 protein [Pirellulales bacterium]|nr:glycoside hydrolase family 127 protein [Pirellulales bacterium]
MRRIHGKLYWLLIGFMCVATSARTASGSDVNELPVKPAFSPLPPGAVEPAGWLRDWALAARKGITGHLDERHATFRDAWKGIPVKAGGAQPDGTGWPLEQCAYWLDGAIQLAYTLHDEALLQKIQTRLSMVVDGVNGGGKSFIYWTTEKPTDGDWITFNRWAHSHMGRALAAWYDATRDKRILDAMVRTYADYPVPMGNLNVNETSGLCNVDAMLTAYIASHDHRLLDRIRAAIKTPENQATIQQWLDNQVAVGHCVCQYEEFRLPALCYLATGEAKYLQASRNAFHWLNERHMLPYGVASGEECLAGIGGLRATETCDIAAQMWSTAWLYQITGERTWGDDVERAFFNAAPASVSRDWQAMCYYQSPNRVSRELPSGESHRFLYGPLGDGGVLCCVGNLNRLIPTYVTKMWMTTSDEGLAATLYGPCSVTTVAADNVPVKLVCQTAYPFEETNRISVNPQRPASFPLHFRIPEWCLKPRIAVNGTAVDVTQNKNGFARIERQWTKGDTVEIVLPMSVRVARGYENEYPRSGRYFSTKAPSLYEKRLLPFETVSYGPLLFALPVPEKDINTPVANAKWQYALNNDAKRKGSDIEVERRAMPATWNWPLAAPISLKVPATAFDWRPTDAQALPNSTVAGTKDETISLVPYGCTKFRISMFPVTDKAWGKGLPSETPAQ